MTAILILAVLITLNGLFALSELVVVSARRSRLESMAARGQAGARAALALAGSHGRFRRPPRSASPSSPSYRRHFGRRARRSLRRAAGGLGISTHFGRATVCGGSRRDRLCLCRRGRTDPEEPGAQQPEALRLRPRPADDPDVAGRGAGRLATGRIRRRASFASSASRPRRRPRSPRRRSSRCWSKRRRRASSRLRWPNFSPAEIACRGTGKLLVN